MGKLTETHTSLEEMIQFRSSLRLNDTFAVIQQDTRRGHAAMSSGKGIKGEPKLA